MLQLALSVALIFCYCSFHRSFFSFSLAPAYTLALFIFLAYCYVLIPWRLLFKIIPSHTAYHVTRMLSRAFALSGPAPKKIHAVQVGHIGMMTSPVYLIVRIVTSYALTAAGTPNLRVAIATTEPFSPGGKRQRLKLPKTLRRFSPSKFLNKACRPLPST